jgi:hypothetical protein
MMPQLGVLATVNERAATEVFEKDCLIHLGACVAPVGVAKVGKEAISITGKSDSGRDIDISLLSGELALFPLEQGESVKARIQPAKGLDMGEGSGKPVERVLNGGVVGLTVDTRGRPFELTRNTPDRVAKLQRWRLG